MSLLPSTTTIVVFSGANIRRFLFFASIFLLFLKKKLQVIVSDYFKYLNISLLNIEESSAKKILFFIEDWFSQQKYVKVQTSGSTGIPKIFDIEKEKMLNSAEMTCNFLGLKESDTALHCLPIDYISGKMMMVRALHRKLRLYVSEPSLKPLQNVDFPIDFCAMTPLQVENSLEKLHLIKKLIIGGASVSESLKNKIRQACRDVQSSDNQIFETYGMSETLSHIALKKIFPTDEKFFTILDNIEISQDDRGCLRINSPKLNSEILQTNDLVEIINEKQFRFLGRIDNVINSGGAKIFPEELETFVKKYVSNELIFIGIEDEVLGNKLILVVEGQESDTLKNEILNLNFEKSFHRPKKIIFFDKIPRTPNGKVSRNDTREMVKSLV